MQCDLGLNNKWGQNSLSIADGKKLLVLMEVIAKIPAMERSMAGDITASMSGSTQTGKLSIKGWKPRWKALLRPTLGAL